jgi:hypothetical protein
MRSIDSTTAQNPHPRLRNSATPNQWRIGVLAGESGLQTAVAPMARSSNGRNRNHSQV